MDFLFAAIEQTKPETSEEDALATFTQPTTSAHSTRQEVKQEAPVSAYHTSRPLADVKVPSLEKTQVKSLPPALRQLADHNPRGGFEGEKLPSRRKRKAVKLGPDFVKEPVFRSPPKAAKSAPRTAVHPIPMANQYGSSAGDGDSDSSGAGGGGGGGGGNGSAAEAAPSRSKKTKAATSMSSSSSPISMFSSSPQSSTTSSIDSGLATSIVGAYLAKHKADAAADAAAATAAVAAAAAAARRAESHDGDLGHPGGYWAQQKALAVANQATYYATSTATDGRSSNDIYRCRVISHGNIGVNLVSISTIALFSLFFIILRNNK